MRTENPTSPAMVVARVRAQVHRARRVLAAQGPVLRWSLPLALLALLVALAYLAAPLPTGTEFLRSGQRFSSDDISKISRALDAKQVPFSVDKERRIEVASDRLDEAREVVRPLNLGPQSIDEIEPSSTQTSPLEGPWVQEQRINAAHQKVLAEMIRRLDDGIVSAFVRISRLKTGGTGRPAAHATAFIWLEIEGNREIRPKTVQSIQNMTVGYIPDLKPDAVTLFDKKGRHYLIAGNLMLGKMTTDRAREEDYTEKILEKLDWVRGVRVTVQMVPAPALSPLPPTSPTPAPPTESAGSSESSIGVNQAMELGPPPGPNPTPAVATTLLPARPAEDSNLARILVYVPRSFYLKAMTNHEPSQEERESIAKKIEKRITTAIGFVVPPGEPHQVTVDSFPDDEPTRPARLIPPAADVRKAMPWWVPATASGAGTATFLVVAFRVFASRRPESRPASTPHLGRYKVDAPAERGAGPSERVRELIRLNPESAASVLHRWIGQGGESA